MYPCLCCFTTGEIHPSSGKLSGCCGEKKDCWIQVSNSPSYALLQPLPLSSWESSRNPEALSPPSPPQLRPAHKAPWEQPLCSPTAQRHRIQPGAPPWHWGTPTTLLCALLNFTPTAHAETSPSSWCFTPAVPTSKAEEEKTGHVCVLPFPLLPGQRGWWCNTTLLQVISTNSNCYLWNANTVCDKVWH